MASVKNSPKVGAKNQGEPLSPNSQELLDDIMTHIDSDVRKAKEKAEKEDLEENATNIVDSPDGGIPSSFINSPKVGAKNQDEPLSPNSQELLDDIMTHIDSDVRKAKEKAENQDLEENATNIVDRPDGGIFSSFISDVDNDLPSYKVQLFSCNQQPENRNGHFLLMKVDASKEGGLRITTNGTKSDPHAMWTAYYALDSQRRQILVLENQECSRLTAKTCVIGTHKVAETNDYILRGMKLESFPQRFANINKEYAFFKKPKANGSELLYLVSLRGSKEKKLIVGFDGEGEPLPLNKVKKYSSDFQAFFRIIPG